MGDGVTGFVGALVGEGVGEIVAGGTNLVGDEVGCGVGELVAGEGVGEVVGEGVVGLVYTQLKHCKLPAGELKVLGGL